MSRFINGCQSKSWGWLPELTPESQEILRNFGANTELNSIERHHLIAEDKKIEMNEIVKDLELVRCEENVVGFTAGGHQIETDENAHLFKESYSKNGVLREAELIGLVVREVPTAKLTDGGGSVKSLRGTNGITRKPVLLGKR